MSHASRTVLRILACAAVGTGLFALLPPHTAQACSSDEKRPRGDTDPDDACALFIASTVVTADASGIDPVELDLPDCNALNFPEEYWTCMAGSIGPGPYASAAELRGALSAAHEDCKRYLPEDATDPWVDPPDASDCDACPGNVCPSIGALVFCLEGDSCDRGDCTVHSDGEQCAEPEPAQRCNSTFRPVLLNCGGAGGCEAAFQAEFPCTQRGAVLTSFCGAGGGASTAQWLVFGATFGAAIPVDDATLSYQYAFVLDSDGDSANNYQASARYPADFFDGTDTWFQLTTGPAGQWEFDASKNALDVEALDIGHEGLSITDATMIIGVDAGTIPAQDGAGWRVTSFAHTGDYGQNGSWWSGDVEPPVGSQLNRFTQLVEYWLSE